MSVSSKQCLKYCSDQNVLRLFVLAKTRETQQLFVINRYHILHPPQLSITIKHRNDIISVGDVVRVCVSYKNIMTSSLSHAVITLDGMNTHKELSHRYIQL